MNASVQEISPAMGAATQVLTLMRAGRALEARKVDEGRAVAFQTALNCFHDALRQTILYMNAVRADRSAYTRLGEQELSILWTRASNAIVDFDSDLAERCYIKGQGWLDPSVWDNPRFETYRIGIDDMREAGAQLIRSGNATPHVPGWFRIAGVGFAIATFFSLTYFLIGPEIAPTRRIIFDVWVAFCVAASATFLGGTAIASGRMGLPFLKKAPVRFSAVGGIAVFIVVFLMLAGTNH